MWDFCLCFLSTHKQLNLSPSHTHIHMYTHIHTHTSTQSSMTKAAATSKGLEKHGNLLSPPSALLSAHSQTQTQLHKEGGPGESGADLCYTHESEAQVCATAVIPFKLAIRM